MADVAFKLCIFGDGGVGKTTLTERFLKGLFIDDITRSIGTNFYKKIISVEGKSVNLQIWDFGGEKKFRSLFPKYVIGASGAIFMYDITRYSSLKNLKEWIAIIEEGPNSKISIPIIMVGGKLDLEENRAVDVETAEKMKEEYGFFDHIQCSAKTGQNVDIIFNKIAYEMMVNANFI